MGLLEIHELEAGYENFLVLKGVNIEVKEGQIICIIGPNGAGKSTLFKCIFGLLTPEKGEIEFRNTSIVGASQKELLNQGMSYVLQRAAVFSDMTVKENLKMGAYSAEPDYEVEPKITEMYELFPLLEERRDQKAGTLSGGQAQMLELARGLMLEPELLLLDEPSAGLAPAIIDDVFEKIQEINSTGVTMVMIEQNVKTGLKYADYGYVLENGQTKHHGPADTLLDQPEVRQAYLHTGSE